MWSHRYLNSDRWIHILRDSGTVGQVGESFQARAEQPLGAIHSTQNSNRSDREKWATSKGKLVFSKLFRLDRTDPMRFGLKFPEILVEWIPPAP